MKIIRCTQKALKLLNMPISKDAEIDNPLAEWYCNLLWIERKKCLLFTHEKTLFSFLVVDFRKGDVKNLDTIVQNHLRKALENLPVSNNKINRFMHQTEGFILTKTASKRILGSMNDYAYQYMVNIAHHGGLDNCDINEMIYQVNTNPMSMISYKSGNKLMLELLKSLPPN